MEKNILLPKTMQLCNDQKKGWWEQQPKIYPQLQELLSSTAKQVLHNYQGQNKSGVWTSLHSYPA